MSLRYRQL